MAKWRSNHVGTRTLNNAKGKSIVMYFVLLPIKPKCERKNLIYIGGPLESRVRSSRYRYWIFILPFTFVSLCCAHSTLLISKLNQRQPNFKNIWIKAHISLRSGYNWTELNWAKSKFYFPNPKRSTFSFFSFFNEQSLFTFNFVNVEESQWKKNGCKPRLEF